MQMSLSGSQTKMSPSRYSTMKLFNVVCYDLALIMFVLFDLHKIPISVKVQTIFNLKNVYGSFHLQATTHLGLFEAVTAASF